MVRETRYLLVGNLPENVTEEEISEYFKRFSKIQSVKIHGNKENEDHVSATVAFADIKSASKAHSADNSIRGKVLNTSYSEGSATGSVVKRTLDEPRPSFSANRPSSYPQRKGPEDGEVYEGRDYFSRVGESGQYTGYSGEYERGRPRDRFHGRGGFKQFDRGGHQWTGTQRRFGDVHRSNSSSDRDAFEKPKPPQSPARSLSQTSKKSLKMKRKQSNSTSRSRSVSSDSSSSSSYSDSSSDSSRSRSRSGSRSSHRASRSKLPSNVKSGRSRSHGSIGSENTETTEGGNSPHGIRIINLPMRSSDTSLRDGLFHEYKKYGKINAVQVSGNGDGRFAIVSFKKYEDARKALVASQDKRFFGTMIRVCEHEGIDVDDAEFRPPEAELDEHHPKATRTLFVGNLEKEITMEELKDMFSKYGEILDIDVKRQGAISAYSFIQFIDIRSVVKALRALDGETMGGMKLKLGFGKSMPTNCVWVDNLADTVQENFLFRQFARYGPLTNMVIDRERGKALIFFSTLENAQFALNEMRNRILNGQKIQIDFGSRDCQTDFYDKMEKSGQLKPGQRSNYNYQRQNSEGQWTDRGRGKFPFVRGSRGFRGGRGQRWMSQPGRNYSDEYRRQRSYDEYSQGGGTPYSEGDFESDLHAYRTQRERQRSCSPDQYSDDVIYSESYREYHKSRYPEYPGSPESHPEEPYEYKPREEMYCKERYVTASREGSPDGSFQGKSWSRSPSRNRMKESARNTPPTPLGGDDTQDFSSREHSPSEMDKYSEYKRSGKDDFDITEADIQELRTSKYSSAHRKESLSRSEERYSRKRSYDDSFSRDSLSKEDSSVWKSDRTLGHGSHDKMSDSKLDLFQKVKKIQSEGSGKMSRNPQKEAEGLCSSNSSDSDRGSLTEGELSKLVHARQLMLKELDNLDTNNSDSEHLELDNMKKSLSKRPRLDPWSGKTGQRLQSELGSVITKKDKSYDVSQSFRKQMEAMRKIEEKSKDNSLKSSKKNDVYNYEDEKEDNFIPQGLISPKDVPTAFVKKRKKTDIADESKNRTYRQKRENEDERMSSDNDESAKNVIRSDSVASIGSIRRVSSGHSSPRTPVAGHLSLENVEHRLSESEQSNTESLSVSSLVFKKDSSSKRRSKDEHSSPVIIPLGEDTLKTEFPDPRVPKEKRDEDFSLPLPKFAEYTPPLKLNSPHSENSGDLVKEDSPCFSPPSSGSKNESPQMSPNDTTSEESQTLSNQEPTYIPEENSNEPAMETLENQEMEVEKPNIDADVDETLSDSSDHNDDFSLDERIRKLDEKLNQLPTTQPSKLTSETISTSSVGINISSSNPTPNIYSKFKIKKRQDSVGVCVEENEKGEKPSSEIVKTMLNRSSIFDLDSKRLEQIQEKYSPNVKSVVSSGEDSPINVTLRTKAETKEMPLSTLPGSLAGRLGNGGSSFPTLSVNTQTLSVKTDDKTINSSSPGSNSLKGYILDQNSQESKTAEPISYNSDNRIFSMTDRLDLQTNTTSNYSPRFSVDNGLNKNRTVDTMICHNESMDKLDNHSPPHSNSRDPRLNSKKDLLYKKDYADKSADDHLDLINKKADPLSDNKFRKSPPKSLDVIGSKSELKIDSVIKNDVTTDINIENKHFKSENDHNETNQDMSISLGKRKSELKKDKVKSSDNNSVSPTDHDKEVSKSDVRSGSESPESKKPKLSPEKDNKSETNSPTHSDSSKSDKLKKDGEKKTKESKKKEKTEGDSVNKDKGFNDKKDKDHDGDKAKSSGKSCEQNENKTDDNAEKPLPDISKKDNLDKLQGKETEKSEKSKKDSDKKSEHSSAKKEKKNDSSSKKSSEGKTDSSRKKENKSAESKTKEKVKSSHKTKDTSKMKDDKSQKDGHSKTQSGKVSKGGSTEKVELVKDLKNNQVKENVGNSETSDKKETKDSDNKLSEKSHDISKEKVDKSMELPKEKEKSSEVSKEKDKTSELSKDKSGPEKAKEKSTSENKHKAKSDVSKSKDKISDSSKHKPKSESTEQHKSKSSHDSTKKDKSKQKDLSKAKENPSNSETTKSKEKSTDSKSQSVDSENLTPTDSKSTDVELSKQSDKTKSADDVKNKEKSENGKQKEKTGNGGTTKTKEKIEHDKSKSSDTSDKMKSSDSSDKTKLSDSKPKEKSKHSDNSHGKSKVKEEKSKSSTAMSHAEKSKDKSHKDNNKKDDDHSKSDAKKESGNDNKSSTSNKTGSENTSSTEKREGSGNNHENKSEKSESKSENKSEKSDSKSESTSGNTDSLSKNHGKSDSKKERKKSGESSKSSNKSSSKKSSSEKKTESKSSDKKSIKKETKKEEKTSPKDDKNKKQAKKQEAEFDWSAWMDEPYVSMYDRVKRKSSEKDKEREMQNMKDRFNSFSKSRSNKSKHSKYTDSESDFSHDSDEETDAFEEEKVAKPSKEVSSVQENGTKRKRCVIDTSTSSDDDDSQLFKSFQKSTLNNKDKDKGMAGKTNKHSVNDIYSSDSSETDIDFPPISPAKKKTKKTKKTKKPLIHHDTDSDIERTNEKQKKKMTPGKPKTKSTPKKKPEVSKQPQTTTHTDTHESDIYDIDSDMDIFDRIKLKNQKRHEQKMQSKSTPKKFETTTDDSDNHMFQPNGKAIISKKETKPVKKSFLDDSLFDSDSDSSFPDLSPPKNCISKKINHEVENKKPAVTVGAGVVAQTIRNEDIGEKKETETKKKEKVKKKSKKNDIIKTEDGKKGGDEVNKGLFEKIENFITHPDSKDKSVKHNKKEGKSQNSKDMAYLDEEEISQAEKLVNNMSKLEKPVKHDSSKFTKAQKHDSEKASAKTKTSKLEHSFSSETDTDKESKLHVVSDHMTKTASENKKSGDDKKVDESAKIKMNKSKKKKHASPNTDLMYKTDISGKKDATENTKKTNNKIEMNDVGTKKKTSKLDMDDIFPKKPMSKLDMDNDLLKKPGSKVEKDERYKIGFGFFADFPMLENEKYVHDDLSQNKKGKKKKKENEEETKSNKKDSSKSDDKTPKKKEKKKKEGFGEIVKENGPKLEELVGRLTGTAPNSDVFDFPDEEEDNKPLFADFFKIKEEMTKKAAAVKKDKPEGKKDNRLSSEEKSDDGSSESHEEADEARKSLQKESKSATQKSDENKQEKEKTDDSTKSSLFSPKSGGQIEDPAVTGILSPNHVKEACKDEANNIMAFASPKGIDMGKSDDENGKLDLASPTNSELSSGKLDVTSPVKSELLSGKIGFKSPTKSELSSGKVAVTSPTKSEFSAGNLGLTMPTKTDFASDVLGLASPTKSELLNSKVKGRSDAIVGHTESKVESIDAKKEISLAEEKFEDIKYMKNDFKKSEIISEIVKSKSSAPDDKNDRKLKNSNENKPKKVDGKAPEKPEAPQKSREEITLEAISSLQKIAETNSVSKPEVDSYTEGELVIDETTAAVETVTEESELTEQAQNETDLAILSILPLDDSMPDQQNIVEPQPVVTEENVINQPEPLTVETNQSDTGLEQNALVIDTSAPQNDEPQQEKTNSIVEPVQEKPTEPKEKPTKSRKNQKVKDQEDVQLSHKDETVKGVSEVKEIPPVQMVPTQPNMHPQLLGHIQDQKYSISKQFPEIQKPEPYRKTRKQKANAKVNHQIEVPGTFYPPVYNAVDQIFHPANILNSGDASEKENDELMQQYNIDNEKHEDMDSLRVSGDEGSSSADKRTRRGRKQQNYKELNSGVHGRTTSPRSRTSPRSPRAGMSPRQALSPLSSPKSDMSSPVVKLEKLPFGCKNISRMDGDLPIDAEVKQHPEAIENRPEHQNFANSKKLIEEISKPPIKEATNVFDFDDNEPELKIDTTPLKATRPKKGRRNTQESPFGSKTSNLDMKNSIASQNHMVSPLESRWQCKKDGESERGGNPPLKLKISLTHSSAVTTCTTNSIGNVINSATIIDSTIPSIRGKKELETKVTPTVVSSIVSTFAPTNVNSLTTNSAPLVPLSSLDKSMSNVDKIINDVSKGIFDWSKAITEQGDQNKDQLLHNVTANFPKVTEGVPLAMQPTKKRHTQNRGHAGEQEMMPPPMVSPPGHDHLPQKMSQGLGQPTVPLPFGSAVGIMPHGRPPFQSSPTSVAVSSIPSQVCEPPVISYSQTSSTPQVTSTKNKPLDMALNMTTRADVVTTTTAHSLSTAAVVTQTTTTTMAQQSPGTSVVMSAHKPMVTNTGNTTVLAGRTVTVKPPNTEAYLHQMGLHPGSIPSQPPMSAHQPSLTRLPDSKQVFPPGFLPNPAFSRQDGPVEHGRPVPSMASSEKQPQVTSSAPTCVVHPITSSTAKTTVDPKQMHQQLLQSAMSTRSTTIPTSSNSQPIPPAHMQPSQAQLMEKEQLRNMGLHGPTMMHLMGQPPHVMPNHIQHKPDKTSKGRQSQKAEVQQPNEPLQRPPSAHSQKLSTEQQRPLSAHENSLFQEQLRNLYGKGFIPPGAIPPQILQMYHHQQQLAAAKLEKDKGHKILPPKEMVSPGIAHQPSSMFATSIASQSSNPQIKSPAVAQTAPSPHPVFSQPSTSQARPTSPGLKKMNEKFGQNQWQTESPLDARHENQRSRPTSVEPAPSPKHWGYNNNQQPKPAHQQNLDTNNKINQEALRLVEQHRQQEMLRMQDQQDRAKLQEIQRQEIQRREEMIRQQAMKPREGVPSTSASTSQQSERDRQTASVPGKPRSSHVANHAESGPSAIDPRNLHALSELRGPRGQSAFASPSGEIMQGVSPHIYRDPEFQQRLHAAGVALRMPHLLDPHLLPQGYPLGLPHPYLGGIPLDHPHMADGRPPSQGASHGLRSPPPRQAHQAVGKSPAIPGQNRQAPDAPPGEGSLLSLLQRYPVMWQGTLALKNDSCAVQMHVISGYQALVHTALPQQIVEGTCQPLRIAQRMRLEAAQLEGVIKRMQYDNDYCMLLALPCGSDHDDIIYQTRAMSTGFIQYLQQKQAAGIVNVADPGSQQPAYVVHIFPPCEFSHETLGRLGFDLLHQVRNLSHLLVIITTVA